MAKKRRSIYKIYQSFYVPICTLGGSVTVYEEVRNFRNFPRMCCFYKKMNTIYVKQYRHILKLSNRNRPRRAKRKRSRKTGSKRKQVMLN